MLRLMDTKKPSKKTRTLRISMALSIRERSLIKKAAKIVGEAPTTFMRGAAKKQARHILTRAGVRVRLDRPISAQEVAVEPSEDEADAT